MTRLAIVFLRGGADGLSLVAPVNDADYRRLRPTQALAASAVHDLDGTLGLHPSFERLAGFAADGTLAVVPAAGYAGQTRSHFQAQAALEAGGTSTGGTGWIGRHLAATAGSKSSPFRAVAVGTVSIPPTLRGTNDALGVPDLSSIGLGTLRTGRGRKSRVRIDRSGAEGFDTATVLKAWSGAPLEPAVAGVTAATAVLDRSETGFAESSGDDSDFGTGEAAEVFAAGSQVLDADLDTEVLMINLGGWDTHDAQGTTDGALAELIAGLDRGVGALLDRHDDLCVVIMSEFGRRVAENASGGFDHGTGGVAMVLGAGVRGGVHGEWPGLATLDQGDVPATNDLRALQAEIAEKVLHTPKVSDVVPKVAGPTLDLVA
ncbi:MAG: DUF1501 domain-containing protein [Acidimicrobiales bacterium]|nr:DUF1501 domain-containing protein [Acidimicrobiales bacterium]